MSVYTCFDSKADIHSPPFFAPNDDYAKRDFAMMVNDPKSQANFSPGDFTLFRVGDWFASKGYLEAHDRMAVCNGVDVIRSS